jgi:queuine tRNA-ribosyltransferase
MSMMKSISLANGELRFPAFLPDATRGVVRGVSASDLVGIETQALVMNTFHLMLKPGAMTVSDLGGLHQMSGWQKPIMTDSGGFQAYSLIRENPRQGSIHNRGLTFRQPEGTRKYQLTPEKTIQLQLGFGADIVVCLDDCTHVDEDADAQQAAVDRTIKWAKRCREEFDRLIEERGFEADQMPKLFAVVQGGGDRDERKRCAEALLEIGFDGYGYGGWPLDAEYNLLDEMLGYVRELIPDEFPLHALGVGHPENVAACAQMNYQMFDSALPTRDARRGRLYTFTGPAGLSGEWFQGIYIHDKEYLRDAGPISNHCDCPTCKTYSRGYLHHLFRLKDHLFYRLATVHNLRFMRLLEERMRAAYG